MSAFNVSAKGKKLVFTNIETQETIKFLSMRDAAAEMRLSRNTIVKYLKSQELFGKYKITLDD